MAGGHGVYKILGRNVSSQYLVLGTWAVAFGGGYLATRKKDEKALKEGSKIPAATADPEEAKFIEDFLKQAEKEGRGKPAPASH